MNVVLDTSSVKTDETAILKIPALTEEAANTIVRPLVNKPFALVMKVNRTLSFPLLHVLGFLFILSIIITKKFVSARFVCSLSLCNLKHHPFEPNADVFRRVENASFYFLSEIKNIPINLLIFQKILQK